jgi:glutathione synthase/RimK-type ligase-like ATP-grasp enzyme
VTIVGDQFFTAAIDSQAHPISVEDWRAGFEYEVQPKLTRHGLPQEIKDKCLAFMKLQGLDYGAMDFIVTPEGDYIFLENNPSGQWIWVEYDLGYPIANSIVDLLVSTSKSICQK